jgi:hypothetical protein
MVDKVRPRLGLWRVCTGVAVRQCRLRQRPDRVPQAPWRPPRPPAPSLAGARTPRIRGPALAPGGLVRGKAEWAGCSAMHSTQPPPHLSLSRDRRSCVAEAPWVEWRDFTGSFKDCRLFAFGGAFRARMAWQTLEGAWRRQERIFEHGDTV